MEASRFITGFIFLLSLNIFAGDYVLVSDLDDTLKVTNGKNVGPMLGNALFRQKVFAGMTTLYKELQKENIEKTYILSASPSLVMFNVKKLLRKHSLKVDGIYLRKLSELTKKKAYKLSRLEYIISQTKGKLILLGDNQSIDHEIYLEIKKRHPKRVAKIYIHRVRSTALPNTIFEYITAAEVAMDLRGLLSSEQIDRVGNNILKTSKFRRVIPKFAFCPTTSWIHNSNGEDFVEALEAKITNQCLRRVK